MSAKVGTFGTTTQAAGNTVAITGLGFKPDLAFFFWGTRAATGIAATARGPGFGVAKSSTEHWVITEAAQDNTDPYLARRMCREDACVAITAFDGLDGRMSLQQFDADGLTLVIDDAFGTDWQVSFLALKLGGNFAVGRFTEPAATGDQSVTGLGFTPQGVLFASTSDVAANIGTLQDHIMFMLGAATGSGNRAVEAHWADHNLGSANTDRAFSAARCITLYNTAGSADGLADFVAFLTDGFKLNWSARASTREIFYVAMSTGNFFVGDMTGSGATGNFSETGVGFEPEGLLLVGRGTEGNDTDGNISIGAASGATERAAHGISHRDGLTGASRYRSWHFTDKVYRAYRNDAGSVLLGSDDFVSFDLDGFTLNEDDAHSGTMWYFVFEETALVPRNRLVRFIHHGWRSLRAGRLIFHDILGRDTPLDQLREDEWIYDSGPYFPSPTKPASLIDENRAYYIESLRLDSGPPERVSILTHRESRLTDILRRLGRG